MWPVLGSEMETVVSPGSQPGGCCRCEVGFDCERLERLARIVKRRWCRSEQWVTPHSVVSIRGVHHGLLPNYSDFGNRGDTIESRGPSADALCRCYHLARIVERRQCQCVRSLAQIVEQRSAGATAMWLCMERWRCRFCAVGDGSISDIDSESGCVMALGYRATVILAINVRRPISSLPMCHVSGTVSVFYARG